jgi:hypothetical protein
MRLGDDQREEGRAWMGRGGLDGQGRAGWAGAGWMGGGGVEGQGRAGWAGAAVSVDLGKRQRRTAAASLRPLSGLSPASKR